MSKIFKYSESLERKKWKEVVSDLKTFSNKGCKIAEQKKIGENFAILSSFFSQDWAGLEGSDQIGYS